MVESLKNKTILGLIEEITIIDANGREKKILAKIDTGARTCSLDMSLAEELALGPITKTKRVISSHGESLRPIVELSVDLAGKRVTDDFNLYNRSHMTYQVLIGKNILKKGFLVDPSLNKAEDAKQAREEWKRDVK